MCCCARIVQSIFNQIKSQSPQQQQSERGRGEGAEQFHFRCALILLLLRSHGVNADYTAATMVLKFSSALICSEAIGRFLFNSIEIEYSTQRPPPCFN